MIIDVHSHVFPEAIQRARKRFFSNEPAFELLYKSPESKLAGAPETIAMMDQAGVDRAVVFGFPWQDASTFRLNNDYVIESVRQYPDRLMGLCCVDPFHPEAVSETARCLDAGLHGVGELAFYRSGIDAACLDHLTPIMALCLDRGVPVMIHTNEPVGHLYPGKTPNTLAQIYALVKRFPENKIILAHWGGGILFYCLLKKEVRAVLKNVYYDTAASPFLYTPDIYLVAKKLGLIQRILLGSDYPLLPPSRYLRELQNSGLSARDITAICGANASRCFGINAA